MQIPAPLTDNSGGSADSTLAAVTNLTALTHAVGTADATVDDVGGLFNQTTLNNNFKELTNAVSEARTAITAITNDLADLAAKVNALISALHSIKR